MTKKVAYEFDPLKHFSDVKLRPGTKDDAIDDVKEYIKDQVLLHISRGESPVEGGPWKKKLTPGYLKRKKAEGGSSTADLELTGELLDAIDVVGGRGSRIRLEVTGDQAGKAEGNNIGSYGDSRDDKRARRFIPLKGEELDKSIMDGIRDILERYSEDE